MKKAVSKQEWNSLSNDEKLSRIGRFVEHFKAHDETGAPKDWNHLKEVAISVGTPVPDWRTEFEGYNAPRVKNLRKE